ncbi:MAG: hypothetical protein R3A45_10445 [Bdellovibrionota bacterium]
MPETILIGLLYLDQLRSGIEKCYDDAGWCIGENGGADICASCLGVERVGSRQDKTALFDSFLYIILRFADGRTNDF